MRKKLMMVAGTLAATGIIGASTFGIANAATSTSTGQSLVDKIAQKFNLNKADVQQVFDQNHQEKEAAHEQKVADKLAQAVKDGKITQAQADQLTAKLKELQTFRDSLKGKTAEERRTAMKAKMDEFQKWLADNKIPEGLAGPGRGMGGMGRGMHGGSETPDADDSSATTN